MTALENPVATTPAESAPKSHLKAIIIAVAAVIAVIAIGLGISAAVSDGGSSAKFRSHWDALATVTQSNNCEVLNLAGPEYLVANIMQSGVTGWQVETIRSYVSWIESNFDQLCN